MLLRVGLMTSLPLMPRACQAKPTTQPSGTVGAFRRSGGLADSDRPFCHQERSSTLAFGPEVSSRRAPLIAYWLPVESRILIIACVKWLIICPALDPNIYLGHVLRSRLCEMLVHRYSLLVGRYRLTGCISGRRRGGRAVILAIVVVIGRICVAS